MRDFYPEDMRLRRRLFDAWHRAARGAGFEEYDACVVENLALLKRKAGEEIVRQIYAFEDKSGRELALRPEMTPTLARLVAAREGQLRFPIKWYTIAQCFRYERMTRGRKREHYQWNLDIIGSDGVTAEAAIVASAANALASLGLTTAHYRVRFSSRALLAVLFETLGIAPDHHAATFLALDKRSKMDDREIAALLADEGVAPETIDRVFALMELDSLDAVADVVPADTAALRDVQAFLAATDAYGLGGLLTFDLSVIRGLAYYTGIVFEAFDTAGKFRAIFGGGRYDNLLGDVGGTARSGVGLGFGDVVVLEVLRDQGLTETDETGLDVAVGYMRPEQKLIAIQVAAELRRQGRRVDTRLKPEKAKAFFSHAARAGSAEAVYIGPDDVESGTLRIKDLATREQREVALSEFVTT